MLFSPFTVKVLVTLEFVLTLLLTVSSKQKRINQAASLYDKCNDGHCSYLRSCIFLGQKSQLVRYPNRKTMGNNDKQ